MRTFAAAPALIAAVAAPALAKPPERAVNEEDIATAILAGAEETRAAVRRAGALVEAAYEKLRETEARLQETAKRLKRSDGRLAQVEAELTATRSQLRQVMEQLALRDAQYAASYRAFREGLFGLMADADPRILEALRRYAEGDFTALDALQDLTRLIRDARAAGMRARNGEDQRLVAILTDDARAKGHATAAKVLATWREAAREDPEHFEQWLEIARYASELDQEAETRQALATAASLARPGLESAQLYLLHYRLVSGPPVGALPGEDGLDAALRTLRALAAASPADAVIGLRLIEALNFSTQRALQTKNLAEADRSGREARESAEALSRANSEHPAVLYNLWASLRNSGQVALARGDTRGAELDLGNALKIARDLAGRQSALGRTSPEALTLEDLADVAMVKGDRRAALVREQESYDVVERAWTTDRSNAFQASSMWFAASGLGQTAQLLGEYRLARNAFDRALTVGRPYASDPKLTFMTRLTLPRLAQTALAQGDIAAARTAYVEVVERAEAASRSPGPGSADHLADALNARLALSSITKLEGRLPAARAQLTAVLEDIEASSGELGPGSALWILGQFLFHELELESGAVHAAADRLRLILRRPAAGLEDEASQLSAAMLLAEMNPSETPWSEVKERFDRIVSRLDPSDAAAMGQLSPYLEQRQTAQPEPSLDLRSQWLASHRRGLQVAQEIARRTPGNLQAAYRIGGHLTSLALTPRSGVSWQMVADHGAKMVKAQQFSAPGEMGPFEVARARAARARPSPSRRSGPKPAGAGIGAPLH